VNDSSDRHNKTAVVEQINNYLLSIMFYFFND